MSRRTIDRHIIHNFYIDKTIDNEKNGESYVTTNWLRLVKWFRILFNNDSNCVWWNDSGSCLITIVIASGEMIQDHV